MVGNTKVVETISTDGQEDRQQWLDSLKGVTIIFVVLGHVLVGFYLNGMFEAQRGMMYKIHNAIYAFHMPLCFVLSGYSYGIAYISKESSDPAICQNDKIKTQEWNIFLLYLIWSIIQWSLLFTFSGLATELVTVEDLLSTLTKALPPLWYLYVLFLCYLIETAIIKRRAGDNLLVVVIPFVLVISYPIIEPLINDDKFTAVRILAYYFFFHFGTLMKTNPSILKMISRGKNVIISGFLGVVTWLFIYWSEAGAPEWNDNIGGAIPALFLTIFIIGAGYGKSLKILSFIGRHSLEIFLMHRYVNGAGRVILRKIGVTGFVVNYISIFVLCIIVPLLISMALIKVRLYDIIFKPGKILGIRKR